jgi:hypothetical protein
MSRRDIWLYDPEICDGDLCLMNCEHCPKADLVVQKQEEEADDDGNRD